VPRTIAVAVAASCAVLMAACTRAEDRPAEPHAVAVCLEGEPFVASGAIPVAGGTEDAARVSDLRWEPHEGCERFVIDFAAGEGQPASAPGSVSAELLRDLGVVRVMLPGLRQVDPGATDASFTGSLAWRAFVVRAPDGRDTYVDLHLAGPAEAHVAVLESPARVVVDLRPGGAALPGPPVTHDRVIVLRPRPGEATYPLEVAGYARTFEANVVARLARNGEEVFEDFTTATAWVDTWGYFTITIPRGPSGTVTLHVGEHSARDGTWEGAAVELTMR
jgi:hypothetical protein